MGTNYYAHIIPSNTKREKLKELIDTGSFSDIIEAIDNTYGHLYPTHDEDNAFSGGRVHLGKHSYGWKFLWNPNCYVQHVGHYVTQDYGDNVTSTHFVHDSNKMIYLYPLTLQGIKDFIYRDDVEIYDEYDSPQDKDEFLNMALTWNDDMCGTGDSLQYIKDYPNEYHYKCTSELIDMFREEGYKFISYTQSDFYSDGLRFSTSCDFC
jgi:hypothetical protein